MNEERITELEIKIAYQEDLLQALNTIPVSGKLAAQSLPVIGAVSGASVNWLFIKHYQKMAKAHFRFVLWKENMVIGWWKICIRILLNLIVNKMPGIGWERR